MDANSRKKPSQLEINDLIAEAVVNAEARRNQAEDFLSDEQAAAVKGGVISGALTTLGARLRFPIVTGYWEPVRSDIRTISHGTNDIALM